MITLIRCNLEGKYASPKTHPKTPLNPAPWLITEIAIDSSTTDPHSIWIHGEGSAWFRLDQCYIGTRIELEELIAIS